MTVAMLLVNTLKAATMAVRPDEYIDQEPVDIQLLSVG